LRRLDARRVHRIGDRTERHALLGLVARDGIVDPRDVALELVTGAEQRAPLAVEGGGGRDHPLSQRVTPVVVGLGREPRLCGAKGQLAVVPGDARREKRVLELVLPLGELARDEPLLALEPEARDRLPGAALGRLLRLAQRVELRPREEVRVARDDRGLL
jgi:hypothetical protein